MNGTRTFDQHQIVTKAHTELRAVLAEAVTHRSERQEFVLDDGHHEMAWVLFERDQMTDAVNRIRARHGLGPLSTDRIARVETSACGHIDYASKFALYCAELVIESA